MVKKPQYIDPDIKADVERTRQQYYADLKSGKAKFPTHNFSKPVSGYQPTPGQLARRVEINPVEGKVVIPHDLVHDSAAGREHAKKLQTSGGALVEDEGDETATGKDTGVVKDKVQKQLDERAEHGGKRPDKSDASNTPDEQGQGFSDGVISKKDEAAAHGGKLPQPDPKPDDGEDDGDNDGEDDRTSVEIPVDWEDLDWNQMRVLARKFSDTPITNKEQAVNTIQAEIERRNA